MKQIKTSLVSFSKSVWFFPTVLFVVMVILCVFQIHGSSIGMYHKIFYGNEIKDPDLIANEPRGIRSDEWLVTTQLSLGQTKTGFNAVNPNSGDGQDVSVMIDAPNKSFIQLFKPQNFGYFVLPVGVAFALKWWLPIYLLIVSVYFFVLALLPKKKWIAILISLCFTASPFTVWWGQYSTLYYALFMTIVAIKMIHTKSVKNGLLWGTLLAYLTASFMVILYPPFQIPCALVMFAFLIGYYFDNKPKNWNDHKPLVFGGILAIVGTIALVAMSLIPKVPVIETVANTAYPGARIVTSGSFNPALFMSSNVSILSQSDSRAENYTWILNQSEGSNFLLVFILLIPVLVYITIRYRKKIDNLYSIIGVLVISLVLFAWMFIPGLDFFGKAILLDRVPQPRLLIGFGLINLLILLLFLQIYSKKDVILPKHFPSMYALAVLVLYVAINTTIHHQFPMFMSIKWALLLALPYPVIIYLLLSERTILALSFLLMFSIGSICFIHPLYRGVDVITESDISRSIRQVDPDNTKRWVTDSLLLENLPVVNGKKSLSGVYVYPQNHLWENDFPESDRKKYNRYAHVHFIFDRDATKTIKPLLSQPGPDQLSPTLEPCDSFLQKNNIGYIMTTESFTKENANCATLVDTIKYPQLNIYIYSLSFKN